MRPVSSIGSSRAAAGAGHRPGAAPGCTSQTSQSSRPWNTRSVDSTSSCGSAVYNAAGISAFHSIRGLAPGWGRGHKVQAAEMQAWPQSEQAQLDISLPPASEAGDREQPAAANLAGTATEVAGLQTATGAAADATDASPCISTAAGASEPATVSPNTAESAAAAAAELATDMQPMAPPEPTLQAMEHTAPPQPAASTIQPMASSSGSDAAGDPRADVGRRVISYYRWAKPRRPTDRPSFLHELPVPDGQSPNVFSFMGAKEPYQGKFYVEPKDYPSFLHDYYAAFRSGYQLFLAEKYHHYPFRYFAELDFSWDLDLAVVQAVTTKIIEIIAVTVQSFYRCDKRPAYLVSMRTPYKVHLNFPSVITTEPMAHMCRDKVVLRCREELGSSYQLDWERIVDFPHGSFRLLGSCKARHMDTDPDWVADKAYYPVTWQEDQQDWQPYGISPNLLRQTSIFPLPYQLREFESSALFLEMTYMDIDAYRLKIEERRKRRQEQRALQGLEQAPSAASTRPHTSPPPKQANMCAVRIRVQEDGSVRLRLRVRRWALRDESKGRPPPDSLDAPQHSADP